MLIVAVALESLRPVPVGMDKLVNTLIIAVNKMDTTEPQFSQVRIFKNHIVSSLRVGSVRNCFV